MIRFTEISVGTVVRLKNGILGIVIDSNKVQWENDRKTPSLNRYTWLYENGRFEENDRFWYEDRTIVSK